jgi:hypothetical protein
VRRIRARTKRQASAVTTITAILAGTPLFFSQSMAGIVIRVRMREISSRLKTNSIIFSPMIMINIRARNRAERSIADHSEGEFIL